MSDYTIKLQYNPKPGPRADHLLWDAYVEGDEERGSVHGPTAADALREMADRLEDDAEIQARMSEPECPACGCDHCVCDFLRTDQGIRHIIDLDVASGRRFLHFHTMPEHGAARALEIIACESLLEHQA